MKNQPFTVVKTTVQGTGRQFLAVTPRGANSNYKGQAVRWAVLHDGVECLPLMKTKLNASFLADLSNENFKEYDGNGCMEGKLLKWAKADWKATGDYTLLGKIIDIFDKN